MENKPKFKVGDIIVKDIYKYRIYDIVDNLYYCQAIKPASWQTITPRWKFEWVESTFRLSNNSKIRERLGVK